MRFGVTKVLDSIERQLTLDPTTARAVVDLASVVRYSALDGDTSRPFNLTRLGLVIDSVGTHFKTGIARVYAVVDRSILGDLELTSNEKMVMRRWADDGLLEVSDEAAGRVLEIAEYTGLPVISRNDFSPYAPQRPWIHGTSGKLLTPVPGMGGAALMARPPQHGAPPNPPVPDAATAAILARNWHCPDPNCGAYATPRPDRQQPPPRIQQGRPFCPRHNQPLADAGPRQYSVPITVRVNGSDRLEFAVTSQGPTAVGRAPEDAVAISLSELLDDEVVSRISRSHLRLELAAASLTVTDTSMNGTKVHLHSGPGTETGQIRLQRDERHTLGEWDVVELHPGVQLIRSDRRESAPVEEVSVMAEAPTTVIHLR
ncbi:FHA domain-containing protein [Fodinicola feengrottensis]|uniref:FHA domain-containing protein n=1 Tax=Fodinicola feengrottensis TaxID=435914 RepID=A0ABN2GPP4_9ACTN|nr:FHA domain-containing protein [Fodinicola feengrottensis]